MSTTDSVEMSPLEGESNVPWTALNEPNGRNTSKRIRLAIIACILLFLLASLLATSWYISQWRKEKLNNEKLDKELSEKLSERRQFIRKMARDTWIAQHNKKNYWPMVDTDFGRIESLSSLWIMDLKEEFAQGRKWAEEWIEKEFSQMANKIKAELKRNSTAISSTDRFNSNVRKSVQRVLSSLLSCYALTNDKMFLERAEIVAQALKPAFERDGLPYEDLIFGFIDRSRPLQKQANISSPLKYVGGQHLEWRYFSDLTEAVQQPSASRFWANKLQHLRQSISASRTAAGLYPVKLPFVYHMARSSLDDAYSFYSYLLKSFIQSNGADIEGLQLFMKALSSAEKEGLLTRTATGLLYTRDKHLDLGTFEREMNYKGCNWGAILGLAASTLRKPLPPLLAKYTKEADRLEQLARDIMETCQLAAQKRMEGLVPNQMYFNHKGVLSVKETDSISLSPEMAESLFVLWRITGDSLYREYAWEMVQAIEGNIRDPRGAVYLNKYEDPHYYQDPALIGGTFKYLYLIFTDDALPLENWVFNVVGQPLPICGSNAAYRKC